MATKLQTQIAVKAHEGAFALTTAKHSDAEDSSLHTAKTSFRLPDGTTEVWIMMTTASNFVVGSGEKVLAEWSYDGQQARVSPAMVNEDRAESAPLLRLDLDVSILVEHPSKLLELAWTSIYALLIHPAYHTADIVPIAFSDGESILSRYLLSTGLATASPFSEFSPPIYWLQREAFWQGAGAPDKQHWLRARPEASFPGFNGVLGVFPSQLGFTKNGTVCAVHAVRPPKPAPGALVYSRFIVTLQQQLTIHHINVNDPAHFASFCQWHNSDRVNEGWRQRGSREEHLAYLTATLADPHTMGCVFSWDGELAGYTEIGWAREDSAACFYGAQCGVVVGEFDQNSHLLVGEERFRGGARYQAVATSIKHACFLRDPRTKQVLAEPRVGLPHVSIQDRFLPQERKKRFQLPHKTAMLFALQRERFFQEAHFV